MPLRPSLPSARAVLLGVALAAAVPCGAARAQGCDSVASRTTLAALSGRPIGALRVVTAAPDPFPGLAARLAGLHVRTRESTVRRELLLAAGDTVDTLRVAESLRRLRRLRYLADAEVIGVSCGGPASPVTLTVVTRDGWSVKPTVQMRTASAALALTERNLLGTGREATVALRSDRGRTGLGTELRDPAAFGGPVAAAVGANTYRDGQDWYAEVARGTPSLADRWSYEAAVRRSARTPVADAGAAPATLGVSFERARVNALVGRRLWASDAAVTALQGGVEYERAGLAAAPGTPRVGSARVRRELAALDVGVRRRSVAFDTLTWLLPGDGIVDVPRSLEFDVLSGVGRESVTGGPVVHLDAWAGRLWRPDARSLLAADLWTSGYRTADRWSAGTLRGAVAWRHAAARGLWTARADGEWLFDPDPDLRAMVSADPTAAALPREQRLAQGVLALSLEREVRLRPLSRSWALDGAAFVAASSRWDPAALGDGGVERLGVGVAGVGLRLAPTRLGRATARLDLGLPVLRGPGVRGRPFLAISISPWLEQGRHRDGRDGR